MRSYIVAACASAFIVGAAASASASAITYKGSLTDTVAVSAVSTQDDLVPGFYVDDPEGADYWSLFIRAGARVTVRGTSLADHFWDMAVWVFFNPDQSGDGRYEDTDEFFAGAVMGPYFSPSSTGYVDFFDDASAVPFAPGDPRGTFIAGRTGVYTFVVTSGLSDEGDPDEYLLEVSTIPEPGSLVLLGTGLALVARVARRRA